MICGCYISPAISYKKFNDIINYTGYNPLVHSNFKPVNVKENPILDMIIKNIPIMYTNPKFCVNKTWYQVQFIETKGKVFRFAQYIVSSPKNQIRNVRYVDIVIA